MHGVIASMSFINVPRTCGSVVEYWAVTREVVSSTSAGPTLRVLK